MLIAPDCGSVTNNPNPTSLGVGTTVCLKVLCAGPTDLAVRYVLFPGSVTFADGSMSQGPFLTHCNGACTVCQPLSFKGGPVVNIAVSIVVRDVATGQELSCTSNITIV